MALAPNLDTDEGRAAYRAELRKVGATTRAIGFGLVLAGVITVLWNSQVASTPNQTLYNGAYFVLALGWVFLVAAFFQRTRYHRRRLSGG
jgi:hypothetical protein